MDTQGAEGAILRGGRETLRRHGPMLVMEFWPYGLKHAGESPGQVLELLDALADQNAAGAFLWLFGSLVMIVAVVVLLVSILEPPGRRGL